MSQVEMAEPGLEHLAAVQPHQVLAAVQAQAEATTTTIITVADGFTINDKGLL